MKHSETDSGTGILIRVAAENDLDAIVGMLADDELGKAREDYRPPLPDAYAEAFAAITAQAGNRVLVAVAKGQVVGCLQLTMIPGLARRGMKRALIEGVRVSSDVRGRGVGQRLFEQAIRLAREEGCGLVQLTTDKARNDAHRFYERLGFEASHVGMKLIL